MPGPIGVYEDPADTLDIDTDLATAHSVAQFQATADQTDRNYGAANLADWGLASFHDLTSHIDQAHQMVDQSVGQAMGLFQHATNQVDTAHQTTDQMVSGALDKFGNLTDQIDSLPSAPAVGQVDAGALGGLQPADGEQGTAAPTSELTPIAADDAVASTVPADGTDNGAQTPNGVAPAAGPTQVAGTPGVLPPMGRQAAPAGNPYEQQARMAAKAAGIDPELFASQMRAESGLEPFDQAGRPKSSPAGAIGIAQFMPTTAKGLGIDPTDPSQSLNGAATLMGKYLRQYDGDWPKALAAYNAGPGAVDKYEGVPPFTETRNYISKIMNGGAARPTDGSTAPGQTPSAGGAVAMPQAQPQAAAAPATAAAMQAGASPSALDWARSHLGEQGYINFCEKFVENAQGQDKVYPSAIAAYQAKAAAGRVSSDPSNAQPNNLVYFSANRSNGGGGHVGIISGFDKDGTPLFISATNDGNKEYRLDDWQRWTGQQVLGYAPATGAAPLDPGDGMGQKAQNAFKGAWNAVTGTVGNAANALGTAAHGAIAGAQNAADQPLPLPHTAGQDVGWGVTANHVGTNAGTLAGHLHNALDPNAPAWDAGPQAQGFFNRLGTAAHADVTLAGTPARLAAEAVAAMHGYKSAAEDPYFNAPVVGGARSMVMDPTFYIGGGAGEVAKGIEGTGGVAGVAGAVGGGVGNIVEHVTGALDKIGSTVLSSLGLDGSKLQPAFAHIAAQQGPEMVDKVAGVIKDTDRLNELLLDPMAASSNEEKLAANSVKMAMDSDIIAAADKSGAAGGEGAKDYVYHVTDSHQVPDIADQGLTPQTPDYRGEQETWPTAGRPDMGGNEGRVYFSSTEGGVDPFGGPNTTVLRIDKAAAEKAGLLNELGDLYTRKGIPPEFIEQKVGDSWEPLIKPTQPAKPLQGAALPMRPEDVPETFRTTAASDEPKLGQSVVDAVKTAAPDTELLAASQDAENVAGVPRPDQAKVLGVLDQLPPAARDAVVRDAARTTLNIADKPTGMSDEAHWLGAALGEDGLTALQDTFSRWTRAHLSVEKVSDLIQRQIAQAAKLTNTDVSNITNVGAMSAKELRQLQGVVNEAATFNNTVKSQQAALEAAIAATKKTPNVKDAGGKLAPTASAASSDLLARMQQGFRVRPAEALAPGEAGQQDLMAHIRQGVQLRLAGGKSAAQGAKVQPVVQLTFGGEGETTAEDLAQMHEFGRTGAAEPWNPWPSRMEHSPEDVAAGQQALPLESQGMLPGTEFGLASAGAMTPEDLKAMHEFAQIGSASQFKYWASRFPKNLKDVLAGHNQLGPEGTMMSPSQAMLPGTEFGGHGMEAMTAEDLAAMRDIAAEGSASKWAPTWPTLQRKLMSEGGIWPTGFNPERSYTHGYFGGGGSGQIGNIGGAAAVPPPAGAKFGGSLPGFLGRSVPGLLTGSGAAAYTWNADQDDATWQRVLLSALAFEAGAGVPHALESGVLGAKAASPGGRVAGFQEGLKGGAIESFVNNLLGPNVAGLKIANDVLNGVVAPEINFTRSVLSGAGELLHGNPLSAGKTVLSGAVEIPAYYKALMTGRGLRQGIGDAWDVLNPAKATDISELASSQNTRLIRATQAFFEPILEHAEQAGLDVAQHFGSATAPITPSLPGMISDLARERAAKTFMTGTPEGVAGRTMVPLTRAVQKLFGGYGQLLEPFNKVPANMLDRWISSIPGVGLGNAIGGHDPETVAARQLVALATIMGVRGHFETTGSGPNDPTMYADWAKNHSPNSVRVPGSDYWVPISKIVIPQLRAALSVDSILQDAKINPLSADDWMTTAKWHQAIGSFGKQLAGEHLLPTLMELFSAAQNGDWPAMTGPIANQLASFVPNHLAKYAQAQTEVKPDTKGTASLPARATPADRLGAEVHNQLAGRLPAPLAKTIMGGEATPKLTATGQTVPNAQQGLAALSPVSLNYQTDDPLESFYRQIGLPVPTAPKVIALPSSAHTQIDLTGAEQQQYLQNRGKQLNQVLGPDSSHAVKAINGAPNALVRQELLKQLEDRLDKRVEGQMLGSIVQTQGREGLIARAKEATAAREAAAEQGEPGIGRGVLH